MSSEEALEKAEIYQMQSISTLQNILKLLEVTIASVETTSIFVYIVFFYSPQPYLISNKQGVQTHSLKG